MVEYPKPSTNGGLLSSDHTIKAVSFDFYNTLVRFWPALEDIQQAACREMGLNVLRRDLRRGYAVADVLFNRANEEEPLALRSAERRLQFFAEYERVLLEEAGVPVTTGLARQIWELAISVPKDFAVFDDTIPALSRLRDQGYRLGVTSNLRRDTGGICRELGLAELLDFYVTPEQTGLEKPHPPIFLEAIQQGRAAPQESVHVGDQYRSDVLGARAVGMYGVLLDRGGWHRSVDDCPRIASLDELPALLAGAPESLNFNGYPAA